MNRNEPRFGDELSLRNVLTGKKPSTPANIKAWYYRRFVLAAILVSPFMVYGAYALSVASPGYKSLHEVGYWRYFLRFVIINSHINIAGLTLIIYMLGVIFLPYIRRKIEKRRSGGGEKRLAVRKSTLIAWLLGIIGITLGPLIPSWRMPWNQFFYRAMPNISAFVVLCIFWFAFARRLWKK